MSGKKAYQFCMVTWNMQGANGASSKWNSLSSTLLQPLDPKNPKKVLEIAALQECGKVTDTAELKKRKVYKINTNHIDGVHYSESDLYESDYLVSKDLMPAGENEPYLSVFPYEVKEQSTRSNLHNVREYTWHIGSSSRGGVYYIYHYDLDANVKANAKKTGGKRTNLAIVSKYRAEEVVVCDENPKVLRRPVLGIRIKENYFFSLHAAAYSKNPSFNSVVTIENYLYSLSNENELTLSWVIMGDYNRDLSEPNILPLKSDKNITRQIIQTKEATHTSGKILDYAIVGASNLIDKNLMTARPESKLFSDHISVIFEPIEPKTRPNLQAEAG